MLILSRLEGESILIGDDIVVTVLRIARGSIRLGIAAPKDVAIMRDELVANWSKERDAGSDRKKRRDDRSDRQRQVDRRQVARLPKREKQARHRRAG